MERAIERIRPWVRRTPVLFSHALAETVGRPVYVKFEHLQRTGSFKLRGAANFLAQLHASGSVPTGGVVACSSGNHGRAVAWMAGRLGIPATLFVPDWVDPVKLRARVESGAVVEKAGATYEDAERAASRHVAEEGLAFVSPFDDPLIIAGQGTVAMESLAQVHDEATGGSLAGSPVTDLVVPLSGGGLAAGCLLFGREHAVRTVAVAVEGAPAMIRSLESGRALTGVPEGETVASALSGGIGEPNRWSFPILHHGLTTGDLLPIEVGEGRVREAMRYAASEHRTVLEGGGAAALASLLDPGLQAHWAGRSGAIVVVLSGGNIAPETFRSVLDEVR